MGPSYCHRTASGNLLVVDVPHSDDLHVAGGEERVCLLDHEDTLVPGTMRATGDWVDVRDAQLRFLGRRDRLIKRHGKQVNLDSVQQVSFFVLFI